MCRFLAYRGKPVLMSDLVCAPAHSLVQQSLHAHEAKTEINGDGFGLGWYGERETPGVFREVRPAWSDENLRSLCEQVRTRLFFAHVRAATSGTVARAACHPFAYGRHLFMHNGQVGGYERIRRRLESHIPDALYAHRQGTGDTEVLFLIALAQGLADDPIGAVQRTLRLTVDVMTEAGIREPLRFSAAYTDGCSIHAYRWSTDSRPPTLYYRDGTSGLIVASEPFDNQTVGWNAIPKNAVLSVHGDGSLTIQPMRVHPNRVGDVTSRPAAAGAAQTH
ncbi:class II glutamine amidotransferase [Bosea sp. PAMC 26642]|uniref:class II glutamine amidotransferase n=1 Tax=Bosea sp. (strain PAMC 26642) TaxID=1792307 RepID=UPI0009E6CADA|nr:class II glutamine amidotransferase [Bosea sp. PAMC 26642]